MLFDETFDFLSSDITAKVYKMLKELKRDNTIIIITKNKKVIEQEFVDKVIMMYENKIIADGIHKELLKENLEYKKIFNKL